MQHIYICFIRDNHKEVDFSTVMQAPADCHALVKEQITRKYAGDHRYTVLTTITTAELNTMLTDIHRWCGVPTIEHQHTPSTTQASIKPTANGFRSTTTRATPYSA